MGALHKPFGQLITYVGGDVIHCAAREGVSKSEWPLVAIACKKLGDSARFGPSRENACTNWVFINSRSDLRKSPS